MSLKKDKQKVLGENFDDERIKTFLDFEAAENTNRDFHLLEKAYRGMKADNFATFLEFFIEAGHDINAKNTQGETLASIVGNHRQGSEYLSALKTHGASV